MITIGSDFGGLELEGSRIDLALIATGVQARQSREPNYNDGTEAWVNPIFIVPGSVSKPDFEGFKFGHFSRKKKGLVIMIAVPQSVADGANVAEFVGASLREAMKLAAEHFLSKGISFSTLRAEKIILVIEAKLKAI